MFKENNIQIKNDNQNGLKESIVEVNLNNNSGLNPNQAFIENPNISNEP